MIVKMNRMGTRLAIRERGNRIKIRAQHTCHRAARADHGNSAGWQDIGLQKNCCHAAQQIKDKITDPTHPRFHVITKDKQHPHIVDDVEPASMQEHGRKDSRPCRVLDRSEIVPELIPT